MDAKVAAPTLYDDWMARRARLSGAGVDACSRSLIRVLDFLLKQYANDPDAQAPARFPLSGHAVFYRRLMVVHHHLGKGKVAGVKSEAEAGERAARILGRIHGRDPQGSVQTPGSAVIGQIVLSLEDPEPYKWAIHDVLDWLNSLEYSAKHRLHVLKEFGGYRKWAVERLRGELANDDPVVRCAALVMQGKLGDLDDIGLLADLLALPPQDDEYEGEREAIAATIEILHARRAGLRPPIAMAPSLYQDWQARRAHWAGQQENPFAPAQLHVLDYLLKRYEDDPAALVPARFPFEGQIELRRRTIVVHHHLGRGQVAGVKTEKEAENRAARVLKRIKEKDPQASVKSPGTALLSQVLRPFLDKEAILRTLDEAASFGWIQELGWYVKDFDKERFDGQTGDLQKYLLLNSFNKLLPAAQQCDGSGSFFGTRTEILDFFKRIERSEALAMAMVAWREQLLSTQELSVVEEFEGVFFADCYARDAAERLRAELANDHGVVRQRALELLNELGSLDDIGLLADLLALPPQDDEYEGERDAIAAAMKHLASRANSTQKARP